MCFQIIIQMEEQEASADVLEEDKILYNSYSSEKISRNCYKW